MLDKVSGGIISLHGNGEALTVNPFLPRSIVKLCAAHAESILAAAPTLGTANAAATMLGAVSFAQCRVNQIADFHKHLALDPDSKYIIQ